MDLRLKRTPGLYLVGFMGSGKTTIGRLLATELGWDFVDIDDDIEAGAEGRISEIFQSRGEQVFRQLESEAIEVRVRQIERGSAMVVALGGGAFTVAANYALLSQHGISIWLDCPLEVMSARVTPETHRPLAKDPEQFARLYDARLESYRKADFQVDSGSPEPTAVVRQILSLPIF